MNTMSNFLAFRSRFQRQAHSGGQEPEHGLSVGSGAQTDPVRGKVAEVAGLSPFGPSDPGGTPTVPALEGGASPYAASRGMAGIDRHAVRSMSGYQPRHPALYRAWNIAVVLPLIAFCLPLMAFIAALLAITQGPRNIFYFGLRIGKDQQPFHIIKFQTLRPEAALLTRDRVLPSNSRMETPLGRPLRETRLDELPQLFNVLRGDMNLLGPRPVRPNIANIYRDAIPDYDIRFKVKPGLVGYTQALMPHGADKAIRARVNNLLCRKPVSLTREIRFVAITGMAVLGWSVRTFFKGLRHMCHRALGQKVSRRTIVRQGTARIDGTPALGVMRLIDIDAETLRLETTAPLGKDPCRLVLRCGARFGGRYRHARCTAVLQSCESIERPLGGKKVCICTMQYRTWTPLNRYFIDRYFIAQSLL
jgi:lipopolysaccharide/colanic/teichoic acid biosynthesis glycosyltransferase